MDVYFLTCPRCEKNFHCDANLRGFAIPRHCPHCDHYFQADEDRKTGMPKGTAFGSLAGIDWETFYLPAKNREARDSRPPRPESVKGGAPNHPQEKRKRK
jgi:uncharacterized C2H2 Zn-finger protein